MNVEVSSIAAAIGEPARARMLYCLMDGHARTSTELAIVADVSPSTASVHLHRLKSEHLVKVLVQGKHRYYSLEGPNVAGVLEGLSVLAGSPRKKFVPNTPQPAACRQNLLRSHRRHARRFSPRSLSGTALAVRRAMISRPKVRRPSNLSASISKQPEPCAAILRPPASIGASAVHTLVAP